MDASLRTQIRALQSRIDSVTETATPEDIVMLAKGMEAVAGQATVFDILDAGEEAAASALDAIKGARDEALDAVAEAGELPEETRQDIAIIKGRNRAISISIPDDGAEITNATTGYIRAVAEGETGALRLPALTPEWLADETNMQILTICNDGQRVLSVLDAEGDDVCAIPAGMYALVFVAGDGGSHVWHGTRLASVGVNIIADQEVTYLDSAPASTISMALAATPVACWYSNAAKVCRFDWIDGVLVPVQTITVTTTGNEARLVAYDDRQVLLATRSGNVFYGVMIAVDEEGGLTAGASQLLFSLESGYTFANWILLPRGIFYSAYYNTGRKTYCWLRTLSYNAGEDKFTVGRASQTFERAEAYNYARYLGSKSAATIGSYNLVVESSRNAMYPGHVWVHDGGSAIWAHNVPGASFGTYSQGIFEINSTAFLILWTGSASSGLFWRFGRLSGASPVMGSYGFLTPAEFAYFDTADWFCACAIDDRHVAIVMGGGSGKRAMLFVGTLSENADSFVYWADPVFLPIGNPVDNPVIDMKCDKSRKVLYIVRAASGLAPHILPVKL